MDSIVDLSYIDGLKGWPWLDYNEGLNVWS